jgi:methionyl-tRNA formyltransferase
LEKGSARLTPQPDFADAEHAYAQKLTVEEAHADFSLPSHVVDQRIRACNPDPGAWCEVYANDENAAGAGESGAQTSAISGLTMRLNHVTPLSAQKSERDTALTSALELQGIELADLRPGALIVSKKHVWVRCGEGLLELNNVTAQGKKPMRAADWARGARLGEDAHLG